MKRCPYCAEEIQDDAIFCRYCNHDLVQKPQPRWFDWRTGGAMVLGWIVAEVSVVAIEELIRALYRAGRMDFSMAVNLGLFLVYPGGYLIGGLVIGRLATPGRGVLASAGVGLFGVGVMLRQGYNLGMENLIVFGLLVTGAMAGAALSRRKS